MTNTYKKCVMCGMCKAVCPSYRASTNEKLGPRGRALLQKDEIQDESFYDCSLCGACAAVCPAEVDLGLQKVREELVKAGKETKANKKMIENIKEHGNPFGEEDNEKDPKELYCC